MQDMRHKCGANGVESKCHICEDIEGGKIKYQLQGVAWENITKNIPSSSEAPFAVNGSHRFDFGSAHTTHVCVSVSAGDCIRAPMKGELADFSHCTMRCWGFGYSGLDNFPKSHLEAEKSYVDGEDNVDNYRTADGDSWVATDVWGYKKTEEPGVAADSNQIATVDVYGAERDENNNTLQDRLKFNPQGFVYTFAGSGEPGFGDGDSLNAQFNGPQDVAVDQDRNVYVADTRNHCIRKITAKGQVSTVAGRCGPNADGWDDGLGGAFCASRVCRTSVHLKLSSGDPCHRCAKFSSPSGITLFYDWFTPGSQGELVLFVADTDNHRIRRIDCPSGGPDCETRVSCFAGRCGNGTFSWTRSKVIATPQPGFADGHGDVARFDSPRGIEADHDGTLYVADTNNHLIRAVNQSGWTFTLAGHLETQQVNEDGDPIEGCPPPCLQGVSGWRDGNLTYAEFYYPSDVTLGTNGSVLVTDKFRLRRLSFPLNYYKYYWGDTRHFAASKIGGITSAGRVVTIAGQRYSGVRDGPGPDTEFSDPEAVVMGQDGIIFVLDAGTCRLRRLMPGLRVAEMVNCSTRATQVIRPSGCSSYDPPVDKRDVMASSVQANIYYNYYNRKDFDSMDGSEPRGRSVKDCVGSPPVSVLDKHFWNKEQDNLVVDDGSVDIFEDTNDGTRISLQCPLTCLNDIDGTNPAETNVIGLNYYSDESSVCMAAAHQGVIDPQEGGLITIFLETSYNSRDPSLRNGTFKANRFQNGVNASELPYDWPRLFRVEKARAADLLTQSLAGRPAALLESSCGFADGQPMQEAMFNVPQGLGLYINSSLSETEVLYLADTDNHRIRAVSAGCGQICENGGRCVSADQCVCLDGWEGHDCTLAVCESPCGLNKLCVAPDTCACIPGFTGEDCTEPLCVQECMNGGGCVAPDTCGCTYGWFDANCTTPVCSQTCGNGGNCTAPDTCTCPQLWSGPDCREPQCSQTCLNGGYCVAPNTCQCPPQWSGYDCSIPVCMQGSFQALTAEMHAALDINPRNLGRNPYPEEGMRLPLTWNMYRPCFLTLWCNSTNEFDCRQAERTFRALEPGSGAEWRNITGRTTRPPRCMLIELGEDVFTAFQYKSHNNATSAYARYTPKQPYEPWGGYRDQVENGTTLDPFAEPRHAWSAFNGPTNGRTLPWFYNYDRHVAAVEWHEVTQGVYICANGGKCVAPDTCQCAPGWMGFDCRTPVCSQGYQIPSQERYVSGLKRDRDVHFFEPYFDEEHELMERQDWEYSNPNFTVNWEYFVNKSHRVSEFRLHGNERYQSRVGYQVWSNQLGSEKDDQLQALALDQGGGVIIAGTTTGAMHTTVLGDQDILGAERGKGDTDVFIARYDEDGELDWLWQNGTAAMDTVSAMAPWTGGVVVGGSTEGPFQEPNSGQSDGWIVKLRTNGRQLWGVQVGTRANDYLLDLAVDSQSNVIAVGSTTGSLGGVNLGGGDAWIASLDPNGQQNWAIQIGNSEENTATAVGVDHLDNIFVAGSTVGQFCATCNASGGWDAWVAKYDSTGSELWTRQLGTDLFEQVSALAVDGNGNVALGGQTTGDFAAIGVGAEDVFLAKYSAEGKRLWIKQFGTEPSDVLTAMTVDTKGNVLAGGATAGSLARINNQRLGEFMATWFTKYDQDGNQLFLDQLGTTEDDRITSLDISPSTNEYIEDEVVIGGWSTGRFGPASFGLTDAFVFKYTFQQLQGGYQCSVRAVTDWEHSGPPHGYEYIHDHPNFYSRYMNTKTEDDGKVYLNFTGMQWPPTHTKTAPLEIKEYNTDEARWYHYTYTNEGHRLDGIWETTGSIWEKGTCIVEFNRNCTGSSSIVDLRTGIANVKVQDTDVAYRPRLTYDAFRVSGPGRYFEEDVGQCVDEVVRGCFNNGTCVAPDVCRCAKGWEGYDCSIPICTQPCKHNGRCILPDTCACEMGWEGDDCNIPVCSQDCLNEGRCVAPDTCQCMTFEMEFYDSREIRRPLFRKPGPVGSMLPQLTGYTGFDCSVPICVQADDFILNVEDFVRDADGEVGPGFQQRGGHGPDGLLDCVDVRCPSYNEMVTNNLGQTFQGGCGFDPVFGAQAQFGLADGNQGCCIKNREDSYSCRTCVGQEITSEYEVGDRRIVRNSTCVIQGSVTFQEQTYADMDLTILDLAIGDREEDCTALAPYCTVHTNPSAPESIQFTYQGNSGVRKFRICGPTTSFMDDFNYEMTRPFSEQLATTQQRNRTSNNFLCSVRHWVQGDYVDDAGLNPRGENDQATRTDTGLGVAGVGIEYGAEGIRSTFPSGRHLRRNYNNITKIGITGELWEWGMSIPGEGIFVCPNGGSCIAPDTCSCADGYAGYDCRTPRCRHRQHDGRVSPCENGGVCASVDNCICIQSLSMLYTKFPTSNRGITGWMGADCSMPMCVQGFYDPFCTDLPEAPGGEGCFRCANGGLCTAPDTCTCAAGWSGYDCRIPVCEVVADSLLREQLNTVDEDKINLVETDPCAAQDWFGTEPYGGYDAVRGNCTRPNVCTCLCTDQYNAELCELKGKQCTGPWQDPLIHVRGLLEANEIFGTRDCNRGYEGVVDSEDRFMSCHMTIFRPEPMEKDTLGYIITFSCIIFVSAVGYFYVRRKLKKLLLEAKINRRKSRRSSEESITK